jgi:hypothetical protein
MMLRVTRTSLVLAVLMMTLLACSDEHTVIDNSLPSPSPTPLPSVPTQASLLRYVSPAGDNHNPGTLDRPWGTLGFALHRLYLGQVLFVRGGTYHENIDRLRLHAGTAESPITVLAYPGENPVLAGTVSLARPTYWLIDNLDVTGEKRTKGAEPAFMVKIIGGQHWTWQNSEFSGTVSHANVMITGWGVGEPSGFTFRGNCLHGLPKPPMSSANLFLGSMKSGAYGTVSRNVVFNNEEQPNVRIGSGAGAPVRVKVTQNTIYGGSLGIDVRGLPRRLKIRRNVVGGGPAPAMIRFSSEAWQGTTLTNNAVVDAQQLLRPEVRNNVKGYGNVVLPGPSEFVDTTRCDGFRSGLDAMIPYGAFAP